VSVEVFLLYCLLLVVSGIIMLVSAIGGFGQRPGARIAEALFGSGFLGYGVYLLFFFTGGEFTMFYYAFVAPILTVVHAVRARQSRASQSRASQPNQFQSHQPPRFQEFGANTPAVQVPSQRYPAPSSVLPAPAGAPLTLPLGSPPPAPPQVSRTGPSTSL
jgi:hypothetical protein